MIGYFTETYWGGFLIDGGKNYCGFLTDFFFKSCRYHLSPILNEDSPAKHWMQTLIKIIHGKYGLIKKSELRM
jgi:hypothetical protein